MDKMTAEDFSPLSLLEAIFPDKDKIMLMEQLRQCNNNGETPLTGIQVVCNACPEIGGHGILYGA